MLLRTATVGVQVYEFTGSAFAQLTSTVGPFASGFQEPRYYKSMHAFVDETGSCILSLASDHVSQDEQLVVYKWNGASFGDETSIYLTGGGWDQLSQIVTIQTADLDQDGTAEVLARGQAGVYVFQRDSTAWNTSSAVLKAFADALGFNLPQSYWTIQPASVQISTQGNTSKATVLIGRASYGITTYKLTNGDWIADTPGFPGWQTQNQSDAYGYISNSLER